MTLEQISEEFKKAQPAKEIINTTFDVEGYQKLLKNIDYI
jgi:hypothetical protein